MCSKVIWFWWRLTLNYNPKSYFRILLTLFCLVGSTRYNTIQYKIQNSNNGSGCSRKRTNCAPKKFVICRESTYNLQNRSRVFMQFCVVMFLVDFVSQIKVEVFDLDCWPLTLRDKSDGSLQVLCFPWTQFNLCNSIMISHIQWGRQLDMSRVWELVSSPLPQIAYIQRQSLHHQPVFHRRSRLLSDVPTVTLLDLSLATRPRDLLSSTSVTT